MRVLPDDVNVVGMIILELVIETEVELEAEEDEGEQPPEDGGEPRHLPAGALLAPGRVVSQLRAQRQQMERREGSDDVPHKRRGQTQVSQHTG